MQLIYASVFAYAKSRVFLDAAHMILCIYYSEEQDNLEKRETDHSTEDYQDVESC